MSDDLNTLIERYLNGDATESERERVDAWYQSFESNQGLTEQLSPQEAANAMTSCFAALAKKLDFPTTDFNQYVI